MMKKIRVGKSIFLLSALLAIDFSQANEKPLVFDSAKVGFRQILETSSEHKWFPFRVTYVFDQNHKVIIAQKKFSDADHKEIGENYLKIDGKTVWGAAPGDKPYAETTMIQVIVHGVTYKLDVSTLYNAWLWQVSHVLEKGSLSVSPEYPPMLRLYCTSTTSCRFDGDFAGEAGGFKTTWVLENGKSKRLAIKASWE